MRINGWIDALLALMLAWLIDHALLVSKLWVSLFEAHTVFSHAQSVLVMSLSSAVVFFLPPP